MKAKRTPKRRRPSVEEDLEVPPLKMRRIAGMDIGPNRRSYRYGESPDNSKSLEQMVSPTQQRRLWQGRDGRTHRDVDAHLAPEQQDLWLESNKRWDHGLNELWKGKRVLGHGGFGVVGLWEYTKSNNDVARVVVKQSVGKDHALRRESDLLSLMSQTGTRHVVGLLKKYHEERGHGTSAKWDPDSAYISRIYLEYCEKGDMKAVMRRVRYIEREGDILPENFVWSVWECLARGLCMLQNGNENLEGPRWSNPEIAHFDIKPHNILVGGKDAKEHARVEIFKIADLGIALPLPEKQDDPEWLQRVDHRGTAPWLTPEQWDEGTPHRMVGTPANVWQIAKCMYELIRFGRTFNTYNFFYCRLPSLNMTIETFGRKILRPQYDIYSDSLRSLLLQCLARDPTQRPTPRGILRRCQESLKILDPESGRDIAILQEDQDYEQEGRLDRAESGWYSSWSHITSTRRVPNVSAPAADRSKAPPPETEIAPSDEMEI